MLKDMKIGQRLGLGFGLVILFFVATVLVTTVYLKTADTSAKLVANESVPYAITAGDMVLDVAQVQQFLQDVSATHNPGGYKDAEEAAQGFRAGAAKFREMFTREADSKALKALDDMEADFNRYYDLGKRMAGVYVTQGITEGNKIMEDFDKIAGALTDEITKLKKAQVDEADTNSRGIVTLIDRVLTVQYALGGIAVALALIIAVFLTTA